MLQQCFFCTAFFLSKCLFTGDIEHAVSTKPLGSTACFLKLYAHSCLFVLCAVVVMSQNAINMRGSAKVAIEDTKPQPKAIDLA